MSRTKLLLAVIIAIILGFIIGWWIFGLFYVAPVNPTMQQSSSSAPPHVTTGYCCVTPGKACDLVEDAVSCFSQGGKGFNPGQKTCNNFCLKIGVLLKKK